MAHIRCRNRSSTASSWPPRWGRRPTRRRSRFSRGASTDPIGELGSVVSLADVLELQEGCLRVVSGPAIRAYIVSLLDAIRIRPEVSLPASMRSGVYLQRAAQAWALFEGRDF